MPARETEAIILRTFPLGEADRLVSFFGRESGKLRGVAAGARRLKNRFGSTLEVLSHVKIWYVDRETRDLVRIQQCDLLESFHKAQSNYGLSTGLAAISEIAELVLPEHEVAEPMFRLILLAAREIERRGSWELPLSYFAFWTVRLGGWLPQFDRCANCGDILGIRVAYHAAWNAGLLCEKCRGSGMNQMREEARRLGEQFAGARLDQIGDPLPVNEAIEQLRNASFDWIEHHSERPLKTKELLEHP